MNTLKAPSNTEIAMFCISVVVVFFSLGFVAGRISAPNNNYILQDKYHPVKTETGPLPYAKANQDTVYFDGSLFVFDTINFTFKRVGTAPTKKQ